MNNNCTIDQQSAAEVARIFHVLANKNRLSLLRQLSQGEKTVGELEALLNLHQPTLSRQLGVLRTEGLVNTRRDGKRFRYSLTNNKLLALLDTLYSLYCPTK